MGVFTKLINFYSPAYIYVGDFIMNKNKKDFLSITLLYQFVICTILFGILFAINKLHPDYLKTIKNDFFDNIQNNDIIEKSEYFSKSNEQNLKETVTENTTVESVAESETEEALIPQVGVGGSDIALDEDNSAPSNVSVNNYVLNQKMVLPVKGVITSEYGERIHPISGNRSFHSGIDIAAESGKSIKAAFCGVVVESEYDSWNGYHIKIQHDNGIMTVYCHCEDLFYKAGANVKAGETIATVGSTGSSTGPHLHFELRINDICYDPEVALKGAIDAV